LEFLVEFLFILGLAFLVVLVAIYLRHARAEVVSYSQREVSGATARLRVRRGLHREWEYFIFEGRNIIGRAEEQPVEIDVAAQEAQDAPFTACQHACITCDSGEVVIHDLASANGTFVNQSRLHATESRPLKKGDIIQVGTVELELVLGGGPHFASGKSTGRAAVRPDGVRARLVVVRGLLPQQEHSLFLGLNIVGRGGEAPVEVDLQKQEPDNRVWVSSQHAGITCDGNGIYIQDLASANGTYVNRRRIPPGQSHHLNTGDVIQIGEVQMRLC
jgi:pSer/pThr/pTyr-binding forkhead associated (FHA) protein